MPGWDGFDVVRYVQRALPGPVLVDNDVNIMALGECSAHWPEHQNFVFIKVATGIGSGIISNGELQRGANGTAGDLGHVRVPRGDDVLCRCGNYGCLEALASGPALAAELTSQGVPASKGSDVLRLVAEGNLPAIQVLRQAGRDVGDVLATVVNLLNPSVIVIGGSLGQAGEHLMAGVREVVYRRSLPLATTHLRIAPSRAGGQAAIFGASQLVTQHVLSPAAIESTLQAAG
jgi:glucokinase